MNISLPAGLAIRLERSSKQRKINAAVSLFLKGMAMTSKTCWILLLSGLAGCTMGPDYRKVEPVVQSIGRPHKNRSGFKACRPEALKRWWKSFGDAQLNHLMDQAFGEP